MKNLILITMDALRYDHVTPEITPNLIEISKDGVFFKFAMAGGGTTKSSMPCIIAANYTYDPEKNLSVVLKNNGYSTGCLHSNLLMNDFAPGFDTFIDLKKKHLVSKQTKRKIREVFGDRAFKTLKAIRRTMKSGDSYIPYERAERLVKRSLEWLDGRSEPYFLWVHFMEPHVPYYPPENDLGLSSKEMIKLNDKLIDAAWKRATLTAEEVEILKRLYRLEVKYMDKWIGEFYRRVEKNNVIFLTADHGDEFGEHGDFSHRGKIVPELLHVPLIIVGEGIKKGAVVEKDVSHLDLAPTMLDIAGLYEHRFGLGRSFKHLCVGG
ncbi:hypothetical protein DRO42_05700 [Candidatus Bathyarchaeota archaeon]|nr:MAG: hypothetical protein DRO42_05700 [Candidatus Bathyarchaeota archaeon]